MPRISKLEKRTQATGIIAGLTKHFFTGKTYRLGGKLYSRTEIIAVFRAHLDALDALDAAHVAVRIATAKERQAARQAKALARSLQGVVAAALGMGPGGWGEFGWKAPKKPGPKTTAAKLEGARKAKATREARGTAGKKRRR